MMDIKLLGYISGLLLGWCAVPQVIETIRRGNADGISNGFLWMWGLGEVGMVVYTLSDVGFNGPLLLNYISNIIMIVIIARYKFESK